MAEPALYREIDTGTFERQWRPMHETVFSGRPAHDRPFRNPEWEIVLVPYGLYMKRDVFTALAEAAQRSGDQEAIIMNAEVLVPEPAIAIPWIYSALDEARCTTLGHFEAHLFSQSMSWGVVCSPDDFSCIAGGPGFMNILVETLGGLDSIRQRFLTFVSDEWSVPNDVRQKVLQSVGWEPTRFE